MRVPRTKAEMARVLDVTLLRPEATDDEVAALCRTAGELRAAAVCVSPGRLPLAGCTPPEEVGVCSVVGFPSGAVDHLVKAAEAELAVQHGATEIDMVVDLGELKAGDWDDVEGEIAEVRRAIGPDVVLKVILETAVLTRDEVVRGCRAAEAAEADFVKTSTGFHPAGGHTVAAVRLMHETVGTRLGVKASGGVRTTEQALAVCEAGAVRIGCSDPHALLADLPD